MKHIKKGEIGLVFDKLREWYPQVVEVSFMIYFVYLHEVLFNYSSQAWVIRVHA